jgi:hypothetical protein
VPRESVLADGEEREGSADRPPNPAAASEGAAGRVELLPRPLSYSAYTIAELDRAGGMRRAAVEQPPSVRPADWADVRRSGIVLLRVCWSWLRPPRGPRRDFLELTHVPLAIFVTDLRRVLGRLPLKQAMPSAAMVVGVFLTAIVVVSAAALADERAPPLGAGTSQTDVVSSLSGMAGNAPGAEASVARGTEKVAPTIELDENDDGTPLPPPKHEGRRADRLP